MTTTTRVKRVVFWQRRLPHYREAFFDAVRSGLENQGIRFDLVHGQAYKEEAKKNDAGYLPWARQVTNVYFRVGRKRLCWTPIPNDMYHADLHILTQENAILSNYHLLAAGRLSGTKMAFWGHGANLQSDNPEGWRERFKCWTANWVDWWFAYTPLSVRLVEASGFPAERITNVENSVDTQKMRDQFASISLQEIADKKQMLGLQGANVAVYVGSLYGDKRIPLLLEVAKRVSLKAKNFRLLIIGDGPLRDIVQRFANDNDWCCWLGVKRGRDKLIHIAVADIILNPGAVGLGVFDSFVTGRPLLSTRNARHGPEVAYLKHEENALLCDDGVESFAEATMRVLRDEPMRRSLAKGSRDAGSRFTLENMTGKFCRGVHRALEAE